jgi:hypothetical protein
MTALDAQGLDVGTDGFADPRPVQRQQRNQRVFLGPPWAGRHQQRTELVTTQAGRL